MKVNGVDVSAYQARFWTITPAQRSVSNASEMLDGASVPVLVRPSFGLREYSISINIHGDSRAKLWENASRILKLFEGVAEIEIGSFSKFPERYFRVSLSRVSHTEYGPQKDLWHILKMTCVGYEYGEKQCVQIPAYDLLVKDNGDGTGTASCVLDTGTLRYNISKTSIVPVDVEISQHCEELMEGDDFFTGVIGKKYPIYADFKITGLCRTRAGKSKGSFSASVYPDTHIYPGGGITKITFNGKNGSAGINETNAGGNYEVRHDMPVPLLFGFPDQKITVDITAHEINKYRHEYDIRFWYVPIFL